MKVLVTGGAGFIASHITDELVNRGYEVVVVDNLATGKVENINPNAAFYRCDILNFEALEIVFSIEKPEVVIHHAAQVDVQFSLKETQFDGQLNIIGTLNILQCCKKYDVKKIIYASSSAVYGNPQYLPVDEKHPIAPVSFYGISKYTPEVYINLYSDFYGLKYTILRYSNVYGIRQQLSNHGGVVCRFIGKLLNSSTIEIYGDGEQQRDFIYVKDVVYANILSIDKGDNEVFNISTGGAYSVNYMVSILKKYFSKVNVIYTNFRTGDIIDSCLKNEKAKCVLGWIPEYNLDMGIKEIVSYYSGKSK